MYFQYCINYSEHYRRSLVFVPEHVSWRLYTDYDANLCSRLMLQWGESKPLMLAHSELLEFEYKVGGNDVMEVYDTLVSEIAQIMCHDKPDFLKIEELMDTIVADISPTWKDEADEDEDDEEDPMEQDFLHFLESGLKQSDLDRLSGKEKEE